MKAFFSTIAKAIPKIWSVLSFLVKTAFIFGCSWITIAFFMPQNVQKVIEIIKNLF